MNKNLLLLGASAVAAAISIGAGADERMVKIAGFGAKSGVVRSFGVNTEAVMRAAAEQINNSGGVKLADGATGMIEVSFDDDRCNAEEGISVVRRIAGTDAIVGVGPTCSNVAEPLFGILQGRINDNGQTQHDQAVSDIAA